MDMDRYHCRTELHLHTSPASGCSDIPPRQAVETYHRLGYHSMVVSNHLYPGMRFAQDRDRALEAYLSDYDEAAEAGRELGIHVILGCELRFTENVNDYLLFGMEREDLPWIFDSMEQGLAAFSARFRGEGRLLIQAHPMRSGMTETDPALLDGIEAFNMHPSHNSRVALAAKYARRQGKIIIAGTDYHHVGHEGCAALLTAEPMESTHDIVRVLRSGDYLLEVGGCRVIP